MHIYTKNIPAKFHHNLIWNDGVLACFEESPKEEKEEEEQQQQDE